MRRYRDWLRQAEADLKAARDSLKTKHCEWACFQAQQAAEKAAKALLESHGQAIRGHSVLMLVKQIRGVPQAHFHAAATLDKYYIPTRYPNGFDMGSPMDYFDQKTAQQAIRYAQMLVAFVKKELTQL